MITTRLYYHDSYLTDFSAHVVARADDGRRVYLDRTAFYPASGGQPNDTGEIAGIPVVDVIDEDKRVAHITSSAVEGVKVDCRIDWTRRFDHMQQHTGQHLLSAALVELYGVQTAGFHLGADSSTIDAAAPALSVDQVLALETRANELVTGNRPVLISFEEASEAGGLRRPSDREGALRIVSIEGLDRSPCGGTHVRATGEIGPVLIRKLDRMHGNVRIEFLCGMRAVRRARADFEALSRVAKILSAPLDETPSIVAAQREAAQVAEKARCRLAVELARSRGRQMYEAAAPGADGLRRGVHRQASGSLDEELRGLAQGFTGQPKAVFVAAIDDPPALLLAVSADSGLDAGKLLKTALAKCGGRGGGTTALAQGSLPSREGLDSLLGELT
jgi:alanyl-tRNA synthetase